MRDKKARVFCSGFFIGFLSPSKIYFTSEICVFSIAKYLSIPVQCNSCVTSLLQLHNLIASRATPFRSLNSSSIPSPVRLNAGDSLRLNSNSLTSTDSVSFISRLHSLRKSLSILPWILTRRPRPLLMRTQSILAESENVSEADAALAVEGTAFFAALVLTPTFIGTCALSCAAEVLAVDAGAVGFDLDLSTQPVGTTSSQLLSILPSPTISSITRPVVRLMRACSLSARTTLRSPTKGTRWRMPYS